MSTSKFWLHGLLFNIVWFLCVVQQQALFGLCALLAWCLIAPPQRGETLFILVMACVGIAVDTLLKQINWLVFDDSTWQLLPGWLLILWFAFSRFLYRWLKHIQLSHAISLVIFAVLGPVNYGLGQGFGAVTINWMSVWASALFLLWWVCLIPLGVWVNRLCETRFAHS